MTEEAKKAKVNELEEAMIKALNKSDYALFNDLREEANTLKCTIKYGKA
jgi:hypothetical protein